MQTCELSIKNQVATITLNRPKSLNALNGVMVDELLALTEEVKFSNAIRAVVLKGAGPAFMAGGDLQFFHDGLETMPKGVTDLVRKVNASVMNLRDCPRPVVAMVHGAVAGFGMSLMLACDMVLAHEQTTFSTAYASIATSPDGGLSYQLPRLVGPKKAMELFLLAERFNTAKAYELGLINFIAGEADYEAVALELLNKLCKGPSKAFAEHKRLVQQSLENSLAEQLELEAQAFARSTATADFAEGIGAFLQKRQAEFE